MSKVPLPTPKPSWLDDLSYLASQTHALLSESPCLASVYGPAAMTTGPAAMPPSLALAPISPFASAPSPATSRLGAHAPSHLPPLQEKPPPRALAAPASCGNAKVTVETLAGLAQLLRDTEDALRSTSVMRSAVDAPTAAPSPVQTASHPSDFFAITRAGVRTKLVNLDSQVAQMEGHARVANNLSSVLQRLAEFQVHVATGFDNLHCRLEALDLRVSRVVSQCRVAAVIAPIHREAVRRRSSLLNGLFSHRRQHCQLIASLAAKHNAELSLAADRQMELAASDRKHWDTEVRSAAEELQRVRTMAESEASVPWEEAAVDAV